jgi:hypothetical protein
MRSVGKQTRDESGKYPVNENDEEICTREACLDRYGSLRVPIHSIVRKRLVVIASAAKQSIARHSGWNGLLRRLRSSQ